MMPDMDGYQVTKVLRENPETSVIPILMFTAKSQVDDKVAGYDAGVDDYLTKPVHPAELVAHIKALLSRTRSRPVPDVPVEKGYLVGVISCRGGLGNSTLALNLATTLSQVQKSPVISMELRPGQSTWGPELGFLNADGLGKIMQHKASEIDAHLIEQSIINTTFGIRLILAPAQFAGLDFSTFADKVLAAIDAVAQLNIPTIFDIGTSFFPGYEKVCKKMDGFVILTEPQLVTVKRTKQLIDQMNASGILAGKGIDLVLYNRVRADIQMSSTQVTEELEGMPVSVMIPPAPELANQASQRHLPMVNIQPEGLVAQQFKQLASNIYERRQK
jgi:pilus assembly protein CpaE